MTKEQINNLIDLYIKALESVGNDAGWHGDSMLARMIEFGGDVPMPTCNDKSNAKMIMEIQYLRKEHDRLADIKTAMKVMRRLKNGEKFYAAIVAKRFYGDRQIYFGPNDVWKDGRGYTDEIRAKLVGQESREFIRNYTRAYDELGLVLDVLELRKIENQKCA